MTHEHSTPSDSPHRKSPRGDSPTPAREAKAARGPRRRPRLLLGAGLLVALGFAGCVVATGSWRAAPTGEGLVTVPSDYVYAPNQARSSRQDYCTASPDAMPVVSLNGIGTVDFRGPCARHDQCYSGLRGTLPAGLTNSDAPGAGSGRATTAVNRRGIDTPEYIAGKYECDTQLANDTVQQCEATFTGDVLGLAACRGIALTYGTGLLTNTYMQTTGEPQIEAVVATLGTHATNAWSTVSAPFNGALTALGEVR
ncbi:hypothetical protein JT358_10765 [Micrococcales bacterium 31B]|nr:hypothetical protein [Micrococcales bacterium 31B]